MGKNLWTVKLLQHPNKSLQKLCSMKYIILQVLAAVAFYANGAYQKNIGAYYHLGLSQSSVHDCLCEVSATANYISIYIIPLKYY